MFERTHFVFEHVNESVLTRADSLDGFGLYKSNSDEVLLQVTKTIYYENWKKRSSTFSKR